MRMLPDIVLRACHELVNNSDCQIVIVRKASVLPGLFYGAPGRALLLGGVSHYGPGKGNY